jgi:hypothetical protein
MVVQKHSLINQLETPTLSTERTQTAKMLWYPYSLYFSTSFHHENLREKQNCARLEVVGKGVL